MCADLAASATTRGRETGIRPHVVLGGDANLKKDDLMAVITDLQGFPGSIYVMGTHRDFLISTLPLQHVAVARPKAHGTMRNVVGAIAVAEARPEALAVSQGQSQAASSSPSAAPMTREMAEARAKVLAAGLVERFRREKAARLAALAEAEAAAAQPAEVTEEEPEVGLHG